MGLGAIVKSAKGVISKYGGISPKNRTVNAQFVDMGNGNGATNKNGGNAQGVGIKALSLPPDAAGLLQSYYAIDLASIPAMSPEDLGDLVSFLRQAEWMDEHLPKLKEHFTKYINRQVNFNQFVSEVTKAGLKGAETIDKAGLDAYLAVKGYTNNTQKLSHKASVEHSRLDEELANYVDLEEYSLNASLKAMAYKLASQKREIDLRPEKAEESEQKRLAIKAEKDRIRELLTYGTKPIAVFTSSNEPVAATTNMGNGGGGGGNWLSKMKNFFGGK